MATGVARDVCVYAIVGALPRHARTSSRYMAISAGGVHAIVQPGSAGPRWTREALEEHHAFIGRLADAVDAILPVRYATYMTQAQLRARLREAASDLQTALAHVRNRVQMTVRIVGEAAPGSAITSGTEYLRGRAAQARLATPTAELIRAAARTFIVDERVNPGLPAIPPALFHLVERRDVEMYRRAVRRVTPPADVSIRVSGPWPPFAFAPEGWK